MFLSLLISGPEIPKAFKLAGNYLGRALQLSLSFKAELWTSARDAIVCHIMGPRRWENRALWPRPGLGYNSRVSHSHRRFRWQKRLFDKGTHSVVIAFNFPGLFSDAVQNKRQVRFLDSSSFLFFFRHNHFPLLRAVTIVIFFFFFVVVVFLLQFPTVFSLSLTRSNFTTQSTPRLL